MKGGILAGEARGGHAYPKVLGRDLDAEGVVEPAVDEALQGRSPTLHQQRLDAVVCIEALQELLRLDTLTLEGEVAEARRV